jgi:hypothetical protein
MGFIDVLDSIFLTDEQYQAIHKPKKESNQQPIDLGDFGYHSGWL